MYSEFTTEYPGRTRQPRPLTNKRSLFSATSTAWEDTSAFGLHGWHNGSTIPVSSSFCRARTFTTSCMQCFWRRCPSTVKALPSTEHTTILYSLVPLEVTRGWEQYRWDFCA